MSASPVTISTTTQEQASSDLLTWIFERIQPFVCGKVLEIGEELMTPLLEANGISTAVSDDEPYDTVIALEAGKQDRSVITGYVELLKPGGHFITIIPARTALFNELDQGFRTWKYKNIGHIHKLLRRDCRIIKTRFFLADQNITVAIRLANKYNERVALFKNANNKLNGLSIIVIGQKR